MIDKIIQAFPITLKNNCLTIVNDSYFEIKDFENDKSKIIYDKNIGQFIVKNPNNKQITFLAIDNCVFKTTEFKKCDFVIFDDKLFCFADIKDYQTKNRANARKEAKVQIEKTIELFIDKLNLSSYKIVAIIALTFKKSYPIAKVNTADAKIRFEDKFRAELFEGNEIIFE